jgi:hypothetical protein
MAVTAVGLTPTDDDSQKFLKKYNPGEVIPIRVVDEPSPYEFRMMMAFLKWLYENQDDVVGERRFREYVKYKIGHGETDYFETPSGEAVYAFRSGSWKWKDISHQEWHDITEAIIKFSHEEYSVSFEDWKTGEYNYNVCAVPWCFNPANHRHHIFPGTGRRQVSDDLDLVVDICASCHDKAHGLERERYVSHFCRMKGYEDWTEAFKLVNEVKKH